MWLTDPVEFHIKLSLRSWSPYNQPKRMILVTLQLRVTRTTTGTTTKTTAQ